MLPVVFKTKAENTHIFFFLVFLCYFIYLFIYFLKLEEICLNNIKLLDGQIKH